MMGGVVTPPKLSRVSGNQTKEMKLSKKKMTLKEALDRVLCAVDYEIEGYRLNPGEFDAQIRELQMAAQRVYDFWSKAAEAARALREVTDATS